MSVAAAYLKKWPWISRLFPFLLWLPQVNRQSLGADLSAGLTGAIVVLPQGVAFATIAGMPPEYGLYAGMVPAIVAALFGSSWHLVSGPTTAASIVLFSSLSGFAEPGTAKYVELALTLALMVGLLELALGFFKLGTVVNFISHSVIIGFTAGAGILIASNQIKNFLGITIPRGAHFTEIFVHLYRQFDMIHLPTVSVGLVTLFTAILVRRYFKRVPYMIVAILAGGGVAFVFGMIGITGVRTVGALPADLPPLSSPSFEPETWRKLAQTALAVTMFALCEALSVSRALAVRSGQHVDANQEFIGQGLSNVAGAFFSGFVATGSFNRSGVNYDAGAKTPLAAITAGALLVVVVLLVAPYAEYMPNATMSAILFVVAWGLIDKHHIAQIIRTSRSETAVLLVTFFSTLFLELELAIFAGVMLSLILYLNRTSRPRILVRVPDPHSPSRKFTDAGPTRPECPQLRIIRIDGSLFFGAVNAFQEALRDLEAESPDCPHLMVFMTGVNFVDIGGAEVLVQEARRYQERGGALYLVRVKDQVREQLERGGYLDIIGHHRMFQSKTEALRSVYRLLDYDRCRKCPHRVFVECVRMGKQEPLEDDDLPLPAGSAP